MIRRTHSMALAGAALLLVTGLTISAHAQGAGPGRRDQHFGRPAFLGIGQLDLTEAQRGQVREVTQRYRDQMREAGTRLREAHQAQRAAVETTPVNEGLIRSTTQALASAQTDMALVQARIHSDVWSLLTPEQQEKAKQLKAQREVRLKERAQRRPRRQG